MDELNGLEIPESLADALRPATLALIVYDMQVGVLRQIADGDRILANVRRVLDAARARGVRTVFMRHYSMPRALAALAFAGDALVADTDEVCAALAGL